MSSHPRPDGRTLAATIGRVALPALVLVMLVVTGVAVVLGGFALSRAGAGLELLAREYFWIVFWTGLSEGVCLLAGCLLLVHFSRRLARPICDLAERADALTAAGGAATFPTDTPVREVNLLAASFNRLFAAQETRIQEIRDLSTHVLHDIKTPLARIRNEAELVFRGKTDAHESCRDIVSACGVILNLVDTNAKISRTYAGADRAPAEDVDVSALVADALDLYSGIADEKSIALSCDLPAAPLRFRGHLHRLQGLFANLLDNALKYTPPHGSVAVSAHREDGALVLRVADSGPGIPPEALPHVFERFYRADASRHEPGFGLGLALVHAVATSYGGSVACDSAPGRGAAFTVVLPLPSPAA